MPKHLQEIDAEYGLDLFRKAQQWFARRGISVNYVPRRGWRFYCIGRANGPTYVLCWVGFGAMVDMLDAPAATVRAFYEKGADVHVRAT